MHTRAHGGWLNGVLPKRTEGADITAGKTIDQYAADRLGADTPLRSLELTTESNFMVGNCENGYSCAYLNSTSWRTASTPLPHERDPRVVFERLFGDGGSVTARLGADAQGPQHPRLRWPTACAVSSGVSASATGARSANTSTRCARSSAAFSGRNRTTRRRRCRRSSSPSACPTSYDEHARLLHRPAGARLSGRRRLVSRCMQMARESSGRTYPQIGVPEGHHPVSHHQNDPHNIQQNTKINTYHMSLFAGFVEKLRNTPDGDGTLLDHTMLLYGGGMGDGDQHTPVDLPVVIVGGGCGQLAGGRHIKYPLNTPFMNLGLTLLDKVDVQVDKIGDSTGLLTGL